MARRTKDPLSMPPQLPDGDKPRGDVELVVNEEHFQKVVVEGILGAKVSLDIATADFKAMLVPEGGKRRASSIVQVLRQRAKAGLEVRLLHAGVPSGPAMVELAKGLPEKMMIRRCPRLHAKLVIVDSAAMYLGSANLTGAGLGAKGEKRRNFEMGIWTGSAALIEAASEQFNALWEGHRCGECQRHDVCPVPLEAPEL